MSSTNDLAVSDQSTVSFLSRYPLSRMAAIGASALMVIGSFGTWKTVDIPFANTTVASEGGIDAGGWITLLLAITALAGIALSRQSVWAGPRVAFGSGVVAAFYCIIRWATLGKFENAIAWSAGWGLVLTLTASLVLAVAALVFIRAACGAENANHR